MYARTHMHIENTINTMLKKNQSRVVNSGSQRAYLPPHAVAVSGSLECGLGTLLCSANAVRVQVKGQDSGIFLRKCVCILTTNEQGAKARNTLFWSCKYSQPLKGCSGRSSTDSFSSTTPVLTFRSSSSMPNTENRRLFSSKAVGSRGTENFSSKKME